MVGRRSWHCGKKTSSKLYIPWINNLTNKEIKRSKGKVFTNKYKWITFGPASLETLSLRSKRFLTRFVQKAGTRAKKKWMTGEGEGKKVSSSPLPLPLQPFFCFRSNFRTITRLETLATQARKPCEASSKITRFFVHHLNSHYRTLDLSFPIPPVLARPLI